jgi:hypothetical protein
MGRRSLAPCRLRLGSGIGLRADRTRTGAHYRFCGRNLFVASDAL